MPFVYLIKNGDLHKIGFTHNLEQRMDALKPDRVVHTIELTKAYKLEQFLHKQFTDKRIRGSEFFRLTDEEVQQAIAVCKAQAAVEAAIEATARARATTTARATAEATVTTQATAEAAVEAIAQADARATVEAANLAQDKKFDRGVWLIVILIVIYAFAF